MQNTCTVCCTNHINPSLLALVRCLTTTCHNFVWIYCKPEDISCLTNTELPNITLSVQSFSRSLSVLAVPLFPIPLFCQPIMPPNSRGWWRDYFQDHPMIQNKTRRHEAYTSPDTPDKTRCICNACFPLLVREQENIDEQRSRRNTDFRCRTQQEIINDSTYNGLFRKCVYLMYKQCGLRRLTLGVTAAGYLAT